MKNKVNPIDLSFYLLDRLGQLNQLKIQKLLYYIQAWHLVFLDEPLFEEDFQAWLHGPVLKSVWNEIKNYSKLTNEVVLKPEHEGKYIKKINEILDIEQLEVIEDVLKEYGDKSSYHLECLTHSEAPWINARKNVPPNEGSSNKITKPSIKKYYKSLLEPA